MVGATGPVPRCKHSPELERDHLNHVSLGEIVTLRSSPSPLLWVLTCGWSARATWTILRSAGGMASREIALPVLATFSATFNAISVRELFLLPVTLYIQDHPYRLVGKVFVHQQVDQELERAKCFTSAANE